MAPTRTAAVKGKSKTHAGKGTSRSLLASKSKVTKRPVKMLPPSQQKTKAVPKPTKRKQRAYTDKELGLPKLNMITPAGVQKSTGKKKGKVFVDDAESMMTILAMVNAEKEGQIESKMAKARQMEEIREARRKEQEKKETRKKDQLEEVKNGLRRKRNRKEEAGNVKTSPVEETTDRLNRSVKKKKKVSFG